MTPLQEDTSQTDVQPGLALMKAVRNGDPHELQQILRRWEGSVNVNGYDKEGQTALHQCCMKGDLELVKLLVQFGADTRLANRDGWSAIHIAVYAGHQEIALFLISNSSSRR